jgi:hypothetical protein
VREIKRLSILVGIAVIGVACGGSEIEQPTTTASSVVTTTTVRPTTIQPTTTTNRPTTTSTINLGLNAFFLQVIRDESPNQPSFIDDLSDDALIEMGYQTCDAIEETGVELVILSIIGELGIELDDEVNLEAAGVIMGAAIASFCPEYLDQLD